MDLLRKLLATLMACVLISVWVPNLTVAQGVQFGLALNGGFPQGDFKDNVEENGIGFEGFIGYNPAQSPLTVGVNLGYINYGSSSRREAFNPSIPEVSVRVETNNNILTGHFFTRLESPQGTIRPYIEGLIGLNYLFTESSVSDDNNNVDEDIATTRNFNDTALSGGGGAGVKIKVYENLAGPNSQTWFLDIRAKYLLGAEAEYLREGSLRNNNGNLQFDTRTSATDLLTVGIGFIVQM